MERPGNNRHRGKISLCITIERDAMRKLAIVGVVTVAAALPLLSGTVASHASEGPWCHTFGGAQGSIENCSIRSAASKSRATADPARQIRIGPARGLLLVYTPGRGDNALKRQVYHSAGWGSLAFSTPLAKIAIATAAMRKPIAITAVTPSTKPKPPPP